MRRAVTRWERIVLCFALGGLACEGAIGDGAEGPGDSADSAGPSPAGSAAAKPGGSMSPGSAGGPAGDARAAGPMPLRRLTNREYDNTVRDLLGDTSRPATQFASDRDDDFLFRRAGDLAVQDAKLLRTAAETLAAAAVSRLPTLLPCDPATAGEAACWKQFLGGFALRAYRRPLSAAESDHLGALFATARNTLKLAFADSIGFVIEGILQAPQFLYHWETPAGPTVRDGNFVALSPYHLASRLSYFLLGTMPDKDLFAAAAAGKLATAADVEAQARRLMADPAARETVRTFFSDWLALDGLTDTPKTSPLYNAALVASMQGELRSFADSVVFDGDGRWTTLLGAPYSFLDKGLAGVYGATGVTGTTLQKTSLNPAQRAGLLTQLGFLSVTGSADGSNPPRRGKAVVTRLLCREIPPPPPNVPAPKPASAGGSTRQRFTEHDTNECARSCHALIDPIGFAFESYDGIGKYRTTDNGLPVDASGSVMLDGGTKAFTGAVELSKLLADSDEARGCFASQWARFALMREPADADRASLQSTSGAFTRADATVRDLMIAMATSRSFMYRSPAPGEVLP